MVDLKAIYLRTLEACAPQRLVAPMVRPDFPRAVAAIGKCAGGLLDGIGAFDEAVAVVPEGYPGPKRAQAIVHRGGHPQMTHASFEAGRALMEFVDHHDDVLFLISGGGSACVELPLEPWFAERDLIDANARLVESDTPIDGINCVRKHLSAIKGGRLGARVRGRSVTLVYSDVSSGALADVASGPTLPDRSTKTQAIAVVERIGGLDRIAGALRDAAVPETVRAIPNGRASLVADNDSLTASAAEIADSQGLRPVRVEHQIEMPVEQAAAQLVERAAALRSREILIAGGEPTVTIRGDGRGGRCSELALRIALASRVPLAVLCGSSDGRDGNSGAAGVFFSDPKQIDRREAERELARSNSLAVAKAAGEALTMPPTGNNLRDLYLLARS